MKNELQIGDWCKHSDWDRLIWIRSITGERLDGYFANESGNCYPVHLNQSEAKACTKKEVDLFIKKQLAIKGETEFKKRYEQKTFFVPFDTRLQALKDMKQGAKGDLLLDLNSAINAMRRAKA